MALLSTADETEMESLENIVEDLRAHFPSASASSVAHTALVLTHILPFCSLWVFCINLTFCSWVTGLPLSSLGPTRGKFILEGGTA